MLLMAGKETLVFKEYFYVFKAFFSLLFNEHCAQNYDSGKTSHAPCSSRNHVFHKS